MASTIAPSSPACLARRLCAQNSYCAVQARPAIRMAISLSAGGITLLKRTYSPTLCTRSAASGLRRSALNGPRAPLRGPETMPLYASRCCGVISASVSSLKRRPPAALPDALIAVSSFVVLVSSPPVAWVLLLQPDFLIGRRPRVRVDEQECRLGHAGTDAARPDVVEEAGEAHALEGDLLDALEHRLALLAVELSGLLGEQLIDVGPAAVGVLSVAGEELGQSRGRVAVSPDAAHAHSAEFLGAPGREERRALDVAQRGLDAHRLEVAGHRLAGRVVRRRGVKISAVEAVRIAHLGQELSRLRRIVGVRLDGHAELEALRNEVAVEPRGAQRLGRVEGLAVDGVAGRQAHALVVPRRLRIPHVEEVDVEAGHPAREGELQGGIALDLLGLGHLQQVGDVHLAALEHGHARRRLRHA